MNRPPISVVIATYNGVEFLQEQLDSILLEIGPHDEVIVVDDASTDATVALAVNLNDPRLRLARHAENRGHVASFEEGLRQARGDIIMLADQDDVWTVGRVDTMVRALDSADICVGSLRILSTDPGRNGVLISVRPAGQSRVNDVVSIVQLFRGRLPYFGSAMAFTADFRDKALPFPHGTVAHDHWLALLAHTSHRVSRLADPVVLRREHGANLSGRNRSLVTKLRYRIHLAVLLGVAQGRYLTRRRRTVTEQRALGLRGHLLRRRVQPAKRPGDQIR